MLKHFSRRGKKKGQRDACRTSQQFSSENYPELFRFFLEYFGAGGDQQRLIKNSNQFR